MSAEQIKSEALHLADALMAEASMISKIDLLEAAAELRRQHAEIEALRGDAERLDWLTFNISGKALRDIGVVWSEHASARQAIDAAMKYKT